MAANSTVQILNFTPVNHKITLSTGQVNLPASMRLGGTSTVGAKAVSVDLATLTGQGQRELKRLLANGSVIVAPTTTFS